MINKAVITEYKCFGDLPKFENWKICGTLKFSHSHSRSICKVLFMPDSLSSVWGHSVETKQMKKFGIHGPRNFTCRILFMSDSFEFIVGSFGELAKFPMLRFSKVYCSPSFCPIWTKFYAKYGNQGEYRLLLYLAIFPVFSSASMLLAEIMVRCGLAPVSGVRPSVRPSVKSIIVETIAPIWFWLHVWVALVNTPRWFLNFEEKKYFKVFTQLFNFH